MWIILIGQFGRSINMKKIAVLGALGMAGHLVINHLITTGKYKVLGIARQAGPNVDIVFDALDFDALEKCLFENDVDVVINCIGVLVSGSRDDISTAVLANSYLPNFLSKLGASLGFTLVHISTDCVFSGNTGGYIEDSFRDGDDNYARTKALGEVFSEDHITIRTSIIGPELKSNGTGLLDWFLKQKGQVNGYTRAYWSGVTTLELAKAIVVFLQQDIRGLVQLCPKNKISKYKLLELFNEIWCRDCDILMDDSYCIDKSLISTRDDILHYVPEYREMVIELKSWMLSNKNYYLHYDFE